MGEFFEETQKANKPILKDKIHQQSNTCRS